MVSLKIKSIDCPIDLNMNPNISVINFFVVSCNAYCLSTLMTQANQTLAVASTVAGAIAGGHFDGVLGLGFRALSVNQIPTVNLSPTSGIASSP